MIYDITRELFEAPVYPGDPEPELIDVAHIGAKCRLNALHICLHNGTHLDAPAHFYCGGFVNDIALERVLGECEVRGISDLSPLRSPRVLLKGERLLTVEEAEFFVRSGAKLVGVECGTVGADGKSYETHRALLGADVLILENLLLSHVPSGRYNLIALPLKINGAEGSPIRAVLKTL